MRPLRSRNLLGRRRLTTVVVVVAVLIAAGVVAISVGSSERQNPSLSEALEKICVPGSRTAGTPPSTDAIAGGACRSASGGQVSYAEYSSASARENSVGRRQGAFATADASSGRFAAISAESQDFDLLRPLEGDGWSLRYAIE